MPYRVLVVLYCLISCALHADVQCVATTAVADQIRGRVKHRQPPVQVVRNTRTTVQGMIGWPMPPHIDTPAERRADRIIDARENRLFTVHGDLWRVKVEENDCDFHLELSEPGDDVTGDRVIVELPQGRGFTRVRNELIAALRDAGLGDLEQTDQLNLRQPLPIEVIGYAFWDGAHWTSRDPYKGHGHGTSKVQTLWELHPIIDVRFPQPTRPTFALAPTARVTAQPTVPRVWLSVGPANARQLVNLDAITIVRLSPDNLRTTLSVVAPNGIASVAASPDDHVNSTVRDYLSATNTEWVTGRISDDATSDIVYVRRLAVLRLDEQPNHHWAIVINTTPFSVAGYVDQP